jgi:hypothetical protein
MAAIITETFRRKMRDLLEEDMIANPYYIGIGRSNPWEPNSSGNIESSTTFNVPIPKGTPADDLETLSNLTSLIRIEEDNISAAIPKITWKSGNTYKPYTPYDESCFYSDSTTLFPCYVIVEEATTKPIFLCLRKGPGTSTQKPSIAAFGYQTLSDGYVWVYIQDYINLDNTINSNAFIQIHKKNLLQRGALQSTINACKTTTGGKIYGFTVVHGGSGYSITNPPDLYISVRRSTDTGITPPSSLTGSFRLVADVKNDTVNGVPVLGMIAGWKFAPDQNINTLLSDTSNANIISASIEIRPSTGTAGSGALIIPHISPLDGFGYHPSKDLPGWYMGVYSKFEDDTDDTFYTPYRQISIIRKPSWDGELGASPPNTLQALRWFALDLEELSLDTDISGEPIRIQYAGAITNPIIGYADLVYDDLTNDTKRLYFHQCYSGGFGNFPAIGSIFVGNRQTAIQYTSVNIGEYISNTGEVVFTENRKPIERAPQQAEELKIIIQL